MAGAYYSIDDLNIVDVLAQCGPLSIRLIGAQLIPSARYPKDLYNATYRAAQKALTMRYVERHGGVYSVTQKGRTWLSCLDSGDFTPMEAYRL